MKKVYVLILSVSLLCLASFISAQSITPPSGIPQDLTEIIENIGKGVGTIITALGATMIIVAGILYLISAGSPEKIGTAKKALIYAIIGIVLGLAASSIVEIATDMMKSS